MRQFVFAQDLVQRQRHAIGRRPIDCPVPIIYLANSERPGKCETVRSAAHFAGRRYDKNVAYLTQSSLDGLQAVRVDAVIIRK